MFEFDGPRRASRPLPAKGIKAVSRSGAFGTCWWANRMFAVVEKSLSNVVKTAGKNYARRGQVLWLTAREGKITAQVQGSEKQPYRCEIRFHEVDPTPIVHALQQNPTWFALLEQGSFPEELHDEAKDVWSEPLVKSCACECPEWDDICKHAAAVMYLFIENCDSQPLELLTIRGISENNIFPGNSQEKSTKDLELMNLWDKRPELALRSAFGADSAASMEWLRRAYGLLTKG